jgi:hypothetical protein
MHVETRHIPNLAIMGTCEKFYQTGNGSGIKK